MLSDHQILRPAGDVTGHPGRGHDVVHTGAGGQPAGIGCLHWQYDRSQSMRRLYLSQGVQGADAAFRISGLELGGLLGSLSAGAISDRLIRGNNNPDVGNVGLRVKVRQCHHHLRFASPICKSAPFPTAASAATADPEVGNDGLISR